MSSTALLALFGLLCLLPSTFAIHCWQCNSASNEFCDQVPAGPVTNDTKIATCLQDLYKECISDDARLTYTFCRKQEQVIKGETRVIRGCGYDRAEQDCYMTKTPSVVTKVCQCFTDGCNSAGSVGATALMVAAALALNRLLVH